MQISHLTKKEIIIILSAVGLVGSIASIYGVFSNSGFDNRGIVASGDGNTISNSPIINSGGDVSIVINELKQKGYSTPDGAYYDSIDQMVELASAGNPRAQNYLGVALGNNVGDALAAKDWFYKASIQGHAKAQYNLARMFENGEGGEQDYQKALEWYLRSAESGYVEAQFKAAYILVNGLGDVDLDYTAALDLFHKSADQGWVPSYKHLGLMYLWGEGTEIDFGKSVNFFRAAAENNDAESQEHLAWRYMRGQGVPKDHTLAAEWFMKAADQGLASSQHQLGFMYIRGDGVTLDLEKGFHWTHKAAKQGFLESEKNLGAMYWNGIGVEKNLEKGLFWSKKAARRNHPEAIEFIESIRETASELNIDLSKFDL